MLTDEDVQEILRLLDELPYEELRLTTRHFTLSLRRAGGPDGGWVQATEPLSEPRLLSAAPAPE
ncbi:MAG TPA: hypothetical protein VJT31_37885, partial [Rugosimonospora sp.]|nr:hypothetical protein [Rugosimonospora sp.]